MGVIGYALAAALSFARAPMASPTDVIVIYSDHWEPTSDPSRVAAFTRWQENWETFAARHRDSDGRPLRHSWFLWNTANGPWTLPDPQHVEWLRDMCYRGYGEIDLHIHHWETGDEEENRAVFADRMRRFIEVCQKYGIARTAEVTPRTAFAFIHGMWALDNSRIGTTGAREYCGVDRELSVLREVGCYADFTFPAWGSMNPAVPASIFMARDDDRPKSYGFSENISRLGTGAAPAGDLLIFGGPDAPWPSTQEKDRLVPANFDRWVRRGVCVAGRSDWVFVKIITHGLQQAEILGSDTEAEGTDALWGTMAETFWSHVERNYADGVRYRLHYVTAREAYNIARAAAAGAVGNPYRYRNFAIPPYAHTEVLADPGIDIETSDNSRIIIDVPRAETETVFRVRVASQDMDPVVEEADSDRRWRSTDADITATGTDLLVRDRTPSTRYRVSRTIFPDDIRLTALGDDSLGPVSPNPSRGTVVIPFVGGEPSEVSIEIYDLLGRRTRTVYHNGAMFGRNTVVWDGRDDRGRRVASGIYICRMTTSRAVRQTRITLLR